jgi:hypothetical protein
MRVGRRLVVGAFASGVEHESVVDHGLVGRVVQLGQVVGGLQQDGTLVCAVQLVRVANLVPVLLKRGDQLVKFGFAVATDGPGAG